MNKILLIIRREYISRVRSRMFLLTTLLTPLLFALLIGFNIKRPAEPSVSTPIEQQRMSGSEASLAFGIGYGSGILIYLTLLMYGMMVLRGVAEEKNNRIAEVIISSVRPFQLMMGKIIGVGAVGITQLLLWIVLIMIISATAHSFMSQDIVGHIKFMLQNSTANWPLIVGCFIFYFISGYLFYAALFAAVGSVIDDSQNSQSVTLPITMPLIFSFFIMTGTIQSPGSPLAIWASIIPFSSPIVMMARIAYGVPAIVPYWQLAVSMLTLIGGFLFTTWLAGKIYRTGILMYGKKVTWKEMAKWAFYSK